MQLIFKPLEMGNRNSNAAIAFPLPSGPYIEAPQHTRIGVAEYTGQTWIDALALAEKVADPVLAHLNPRWGHEYFANVAGMAVKVAFYYDTSD